MLSELHGVFHGSEWADNSQKRISAGLSPRGSLVWGKKPKKSLVGLPWLYNFKEPRSTHLGKRKTNPAPCSASRLRVTLKRAAQKDPYDGNLHRPMCVFLILRILSRLLIIVEDNCDNRRMTCLKYVTLRASFSFTPLHTLPGLLF